MIGIYLLVTIGSYFSPQVIPALINPGPSEVIVEFEELNGIKDGVPVLAGGQWIGSVSQVESSHTDAKSQDNSDESFNVSVKIHAPFRGILRRGTVGLIISPVSVFNAEPQTVVELITPNITEGPALKKNDVVVGYSSYLDFWSATPAEGFIEAAAT